ncbi:MAG: hypothetical protein ACTHQQ_07115 [Solirubrobacteraceae bacterium]
MPVVDAAGCVAVDPHAAANSVTNPSSAAKTVFDLIDPVLVRPDRPRAGNDLDPRCMAGLQVRQALEVVVEQGEAYSSPCAAALKEEQVAAVRVNADEVAIQRQHTKLRH